MAQLTDLRQPAPTVVLVILILLSLFKAAVGPVVQLVHQLRKLHSVLVGVEHRGAPLLVAAHQAVLVVIRVQVAQAPVAVVTSELPALVVAVVAELLEAVARAVVPVVWACLD